MITESPQSKMLSDYVREWGERRVSLGSSYASLGGLRYTVDIVFMGV